MFVVKSIVVQMKGQGLDILMVPHTVLFCVREKGLLSIWPTSQNIYIL